MIRIALLQDAESIYNIEKESFNFERYSLNTILEDLQKNNYLYLVYVYNNEVVGYISFSFVLSESELIKIAVLKEQRKKHVATKLLLAAIKLLKNKKIQLINLEVNENNKPAIQFYLKNGFKQVAVRKKYYKNDDALILTKTI